MMKIDYISYVEANKKTHSNLTPGKRYGIFYVRPSDRCFRVIGDNGEHVLDKEREETDPTNSCYFNSIKDIQSADITIENTDEVIKYLVARGETLKESIKRYRLGDMYAQSDCVVMKKTEELTYVRNPEYKKFLYIKDPHIYQSPVDLYMSSMLNI